MNKKIFIILIAFLSITSHTFAQPDSILVTFAYKADSTRHVALAGSFNGWSTTVNPFIFKDSLWLCNVKLAPGYYYYKIVVDSIWLPDPKNNWRINDGGTSYNSIIKVGEPSKPKRQYSTISLNVDLLPKPILEDNPEWIDLYYKAWDLAWNKISYGSPENQFVPKYMDEGFNELIFQWDTNFMAAFAVYSNGIFPAMQSLNNFYSKQRSDGYIQRVYREKDGTQVQEPTVDEPMLNPPLFAWVELKYYHVTGDQTRLREKFPIIIKYYNWIEKNLKSKLDANLFYNTPLGSGMDNTPRANIDKGGWIDFTSQQAFAAKCIAEIADIIGENKTSEIFTKKYDEIINSINNFCWSNDKQFYFDVSEDSSLSSTMHIGGFWTLLAEACPTEYYLYLREHLTNPAEFWRPHLIPTLTASDPVYDPKGHYWLGSVWAPTNYMVVKGLEAYGDFELAHRIAHNHLSNMAEVYYNFKPDEDNIAFEERYGDSYQTIWECYSAEYPKPATRWDNTFYSRQDFVGWSGLGPIAMLIENILGLNIRADKNLIIWYVQRDDKHGIENLKFGNQRINMVCNPKPESLEIEIKAAKPFKMEIIWNDNIYSKDVNPGLNIFLIE